MSIMRMDVNRVYVSSLPFPLTPSSAARAYSVSSLTISVNGSEEALSRIQASTMSMPHLCAL